MQTDSLDQRQMDKMANYQMEDRHRMVVIAYLAVCWVIAIAAIVVIGWM